MDDDYREEHSFSIRLEAIARFGDDYDGDDDGFVWREDFHRKVQPKLTALVLSALQGLEGLEGWKVRTGNRGVSQTDEILIRLERTY